MAKKTLDQIAADMRAEVARDGRPAVRLLGRGLRIELSALPEAWYMLQITRMAGPAGEQEIAIVRRAFGVPEEAEQRVDDMQRVWVKWRPQ